MKLNIENFFYYLGVSGILLSGMVPLFRYGSLVAIVVQLLIALCVFGYFHKNFFSNHSLYYVLFFLLLSGVNYVLHYPFEDNKLLGSVVELIAGFFIISQLRFLKFKRVWLNLITIISLYSIIIFVFVYFDLLSVNAIITRDGKDFIMSYGTVFGWSVQSQRLSGFYHEPGAFQIYLNFTLLLFMRELQKFELSSFDWFKIVVIVIAILLTQSTMGYIVFGIIFGLVIFKSNLVRHYRLITVPIFLMILLGVWLIIAGSDVVNSKLSRDEPSISLTVRASDNIGLLKMISEAPLLGVGVGSTRFSQKSLLYGNTTSSNGWLAFTAGFGVFWFVIFTVWTFLALKKMDLRIPTITALLILLLLHSNENYTHFVSAYIFIFKFYSYD